MHSFAAADSAIDRPLWRRRCRPRTARPPVLTRSARRTPTPKKTPTTGAAWIETPDHHRPTREVGSPPHRSDGWFPSPSGAPASTRRAGRGKPASRRSRIP